MLFAKSKFVAFISILFAGFITLVGFFFWGISKGKEAQKDKQLLSDLQTATNELEKADEVRQAFIKHEQTLKAGIIANSAAKHEAQDEAKLTKTYDLNKWIVITTCFFSVSCVSNETVYYKTTLPYLPYQQVFERPVYDGDIITYLEEDTVAFSREDFNKVWNFITELKEVIKNYEFQVERTNEYNLLLESLYKIRR